MCNKCVPQRQCTQIGLHNHTDYSNIRLLDSINRVEDLVDTALELNYSGIAITDHEFIGSHHKAIKYVEEGKKIDEKTGLSKIPQDFKLILGNEIYLVEDAKWCQDNYYNKDVEVKFFHYLLLAKNKEGHKALRKLSSRAWKNSFITGLMERVPTEEWYLEKVVKEFPNTLIATSACMGGRIPYEIMKGNLDGAREYIKWNISLFGKEDFYLELQPATYEDQVFVNHQLVEFAKEFDLKLVITSDAHYARPEDAPVHEAFLNAKEGDREVADFYGHTYLHSTDEIYEKMSYLPEEIITEALNNTLEIGDKVESYSLEQETIIPRINLPKFENKHIFKSFYHQYEYIAKMSNSEEEQDRYLMHLIEEGFIKLVPFKEFSNEKFHQYLARINEEVGELWKLSKKMNQAVSSYYVTTARLVDIIWGDDECSGSFESGSLVGFGRGSAVAFLINYLMGITMVNPLEYGIEIPSWRHLNSEMGNISSLDIDIDINAMKRQHIFERLREEFGEDNFLSVCTFGTQASRSAVRTACRGLGISNDVADYLASLIPFERGKLWDIEDCLYGNEKKQRKPVTQFVNEVRKYENLEPTLIKIQGLVDKRSTHAGGVVVLNNHYIEQNALMRSPDGTYTTQFNLDDTQALGAIKMDLLSLDALTKIQEAFNYLIKDGKIEKQGTLRETFEKYFHPDVLDLENKELFDLASSGTVQDLFQFSTDVGYNAVTHAKPENMIDLMALNSVMRLMNRLGESPLTTFAKFKENIQLWYDEMDEYGLSPSEVKMMEEHLLKLSGIADSQESAMLLAMDERVCGFNLQEATKLRKVIAGSNEKNLRELKELVYSKGRALGTSENLLRYFWEVQLGAQLGYSFSSPHILAYTLIAMLQLNLNTKYNHLYWLVAVLNTNAGAIEVDEDAKQRDNDYGKVAKAVDDLAQQGIRVAPPLINTADYSFTPDIKNNQIIYSLKAIRGVNEQVTNVILEKRPFDSLEDFIERAVEATDVIKPTNVVQLIKAGVFSEFGNTREIMAKYIMSLISPKDKLNGQNLNRCVNMGLFTEEWKDYVEIFNLRTTVNKQVHKKVTKPNDTLLRVKPEQINVLTNHLGSGIIVEYEGQDTIISKKELDKEYKTFIEPLIEHMNTENFLKKYNQALFVEEWVQRTKGGTVEKWAMDSLTYYPDKHELDSVVEARYNISNFFELDENPEPLGYSKWSGREFPYYQIGTIMGTVIDKNNTKHTVTLLTKEGVVICKLYAGLYAHYNKSIKSNGVTVEDSWFKRGNLLLVNGYRRGEQWVVKKSKQQEHSISLITEVQEGGVLSLQNERVNL